MDLATLIGFFGGLAMMAVGVFTSFWHYGKGF